MRTKKMVLAWFHIFLKSPMLEKPISCLRKLVSFQIVFNKQAQQIENTKVFCKTLKCFARNTVLPQTLLCLAIRLTIVITYLHTVMQIVRKMISAHISRPLCHCWRCRHRCHGCLIAAAIAADIAAVTIAAATATATAAAVSTATTMSTVIAAAFWLIVVCPCAASATATIACPRPCCCWLPTQLSLWPRRQTAAPCSFRHNHCLCVYHCFP